MSLSVLILALVTIQRLAELLIARSNTRALLAKGGVERGADHYPAIVSLHAAWLTGLWVLAWNMPANPEWLAVYGAIEVLRAWTLVTLGRRWTTRIIVVPGERLVRRGPYRFVAHPNYIVVVAEIAVLPLVFGLPAYAAVFSLMNAAALFVRVRAENAALHGPSSWIPYRSR